MSDTRFNRRDFLKIATALGVTAAWPARLIAEDSKATARPNILLIMADDMGYECVGANGGTSYRTPVLDELARTGVRFEHCYSQPLCTPSRVQLLTGAYNVRNYVRFGVLDRSQTTFAQLLKNQGYATCVAGKWQLGKEQDSPRHFGFDESCLWQHTRGARNEARRDTRYANPRLEVNGKPVNFADGKYGPDVACDFLCEFMEKNKDRPFLAYYPMILPHCPFMPAPGTPGWDAKSKGSPTYKGKARFFGAMVEHVDKLVGRLVAKLSALGLRDNTLVLFTGDNGTDRPVVSACAGVKVAGGKGKMTDAGTRVPLIAHGPGLVRSGVVSDDLVDFSDFLPTLAGAAGVAVPSTSTVDGRSFLPRLRGEKGDPREWVYCWYSRNGGATGKEWARNRRYKLYRTGEFYDVAKDVMEIRPLTELSPEARRARGMLQKALARYRDARPDAIAARGGRKRK